jgi:hypothetical protein
VLGILDREDRPAGIFCSGCDGEAAPREVLADFRTSVEVSKTPRLSNFSCLFHGNRIEIGLPWQQGGGTFRDRLTGRRREVSGESLRVELWH